MRVQRLLLVEDVPDDNPDLETWSIGNVISEHTNRCTCERVLQIRFMNGDEHDICQDAIYRLHARISQAPKRFVLPISSPTQNMIGPSSPIPLYDGYASSADSGGSNSEPQEFDINSGKETTEYEGTLPGGIPNNPQTPTALSLPPRSPKFRAKRPTLTESQGVQRECRARSALSQI